MRDSRRSQPELPALAGSSADAAQDGDAQRDGVIERFLFTSDDQRWAVARVRPDRGEAFSAVGAIGGLKEGERVRLVGRIEHNPRFGEQFKAEAAYPLLPHTAEGIRNYLAHGKVQGIGAGLADRLVSRFGGETLHVIEHEPERLAEVEGIGPIRSQHIQEAFCEGKAQREAMVFLQGHAVPPALATRIWEKYADATIALTRENPFRLAEEVAGVGFATADGISRALGFECSSPARAAAGVVHLLTKAGDDGHVFLPHRILLEQAHALLGREAPVAKEVERLIDEGRLVAEPDGAIYLPRVRAVEVEAAIRLRALQEESVSVLADDVSAFELASGLSLAAAQREAVLRAAADGVLLLTGGPGTGKTTLVRALVDLFERAELKVALAAPTGRAARRLADATDHDARTLHRLLEYSPREDRFTRDEHEPIEVDAVVVDEASMIDVYLFTALLRALIPGTRLILVGDADQLPSVGAGDVLRDLIRSGEVPVVRLEQIFRQGAESRIVANAHRILRGELPDTPRNPDNCDFFFVRADKPEIALELIREMVAHRIPRRWGLDAVDDIQVLTPMRRGICGAHRLNAELQALLNPSAEPVADGGRPVLSIGDKVMQIRNDYDKDVFNGDLGRVVGRDGAKLRVRFDDRIVNYEGEERRSVVLAYACSVHKSQGSEYPAVVVPVLNEHWNMLQRNLLYTAVTRGKRLVVLVGQLRSLERAVNNGDADHRHTALARRLREDA